MWISLLGKFFHTPEWVSEELAPVMPACPAHEARLRGLSPIRGPGGGEDKAPGQVRLLEQVALEVVQGQ